MKMKNLEIELVTFDAQDVIATSGGLQPAGMPLSTGVYGLDNDKNGPFYFGVDGMLTPPSADVPSYIITYYNDSTLKDKNGKSMNDWKAVYGNSVKDYWLYSYENGTFEWVLKNQQ